MEHRASAVGISLTYEDAAIVKGMLMWGDRQHDIAAWFGVNGGCVGEIAGRQKFANVEPAPANLLPPPGPYLAGRDTAVLIQATSTARKALDAADAVIRDHFSR